MKKNLWIIFVAFFALIGFAIYFTQSAWCLWALMFTPSISWGQDEDKTDIE
jgi:hypothetical protein